MMYKISNKNKGKNYFGGEYNIQSQHRSENILDERTPEFKSSFELRKHL